MDYINYLIDRKDEMVTHLSQLIQIPSVEGQATDKDPYGQACTAALDHMLALGQAEGFKTVNLDNHVGYIEYGDSEDYIAVLSHLDVVPVGNDWTKDPFGGQVLDGAIYGRGTLDDKGPAMASFYALKALKHCGYEPKTKIRLIFGLNEESGSKCVKHYLKFEKPPLLGFTPDGDFPVIYAEKGIANFEISKSFKSSLADGGIEIISIQGGHATNMVPDYCEAMIRETTDITGLVDAFNQDYHCHVKIDRSNDLTKLSVKGVSAHASTPEKGKNAISLLMSCLDALDLQIGDASSFVRGYARMIGMTTGGEGMGLELEDDMSGGLTLNVGIINMDEKSGSCKINIRYPVTLTTDQVFNDVFKGIMQYEQMTFDILVQVDPIVHQKDSLLIKTLMDIYEKHTGDHGAEPICIGGGTYARSMPGIVAFGPLFKDSEDTMHQADEHLTIEDYMKITKIYADAMYALSH